MNEPLRVLVADDESVARRRLLRLLSAMPDVSVCGEAEDGASVLTRVRAGGVDVVLLDIHMPGLDGLEAMALLPADGPYVIFCTAQAEHAVRAFDAGAVDYLLKPVEAARLQKALERARSHEALRRFQGELRQHQARPPEPPRSFERLAIPTRQGIVLLNPADVSHAQLDGELVTVFTARESFLTDFTLQELQGKLPPERFERVHRRALLNLEHVTRLEPTETGGFLARTRAGHAVEVSRQVARELRRRMGLRRAPEGDEREE